MNKLKYVVGIFILILSCKPEIEKNIITKNLTEHYIKQSLINGYFTKVSENVGVSIYQDNIFYFSTSPDGFSKNKFLLHLVKKNNDFDNVDFFKDKYLLNDSLKGKFSSLNIVQYKINLDSYESIRVGQFYRNDDTSINKEWSKQLKVQDILAAKEKYKNQYLSYINSNLLNDDFKKELEFGSFFKSKMSFYVLLSDTNIYFITKNEDLITEKFMLHYIMEDNSFINNSFNFNNKLYNPFLEQPFKEFKIAKMSLPFYEEFYKIRFGQYNSAGNLWTQTINLEEILSNELLTYKGELNN